MIFHLRPGSVAETPRHQELALDTSRRDQIITVSAASLALLIVAAIAVLMGMA